MSLPPYRPSRQFSSRLRSEALANEIPPIVITSRLRALSNPSEYTLQTIPVNEQMSPTNPETPLQSDTSRTYGSTPTSPRFLPLSPGVPSLRRPLINAALRMTTLFVLSCIILGGTLWVALPTVEEADRPLLHIPKSFDELKALNGLLKKYRDIYPYRIVICYVITYLFLQAFSLPGSMYLSILGGAVWGVPRAILLACTCVATGATLCYLISAALGPALLAIPKWKERLDRWADKLDEHRSNMISFLIVIRISPLPPHWVVNVLCPHLGIGIPTFWVSTWLGILGVTIIHTTIGKGLEDMTTADDFHLISWRNFFGLAAIVVAVLIPVGLRHVWKKELQSVARVDAGDPETSEVETPLVVYGVEDEEDGVLGSRPTVAAKRKKTTVLGDGLDGNARLVLMQNDDEDEDVVRDDRFYPEEESSVDEDDALDEDGKAKGDHN